MGERTGVSYTPVVQSFRESDGTLGQGILGHLDLRPAIDLEDSAKPAL